jgi:hypothetical protein
MVTLGDWPDYNTMNNGWTLIGKKKSLTYSYLIALYRGI